MQISYKFKMTARCPNDHLPDLYEVEVISSRTIFAEELIEVSNKIGASDIHLSQEDITEKLARHFAATVITKGCHYGVLTKVKA